MPIDKPSSLKHFRVILLMAITLLNTTALLFVLLFLFKPGISWGKKINSSSATPHVTPKPDNSTDTISVHKFEIIGSTVFSQAYLATIVKPYEGRDLTFEELLEVRTQITKLYIDRGFVTSGAYIPPQTFESSVKILVVEGILPTIKVEGNKRINADYIRFRVQLGVTRPFNINKLQNQLELLRSELLFKQVTAELSAGKNPGENILIVRVTEVDYAKISALIEKLKSGQSVNERLNAIEALMKLGTPAAIAVPLGKLSAETEAAIPKLILGLKDSDSDVRSSAALILGRIGAAAKNTIPDLVINLKDSDSTLRKYTVSAIGSIAISVNEKINTLSIIELHQAISDLEAALKVLQNQPTQFSSDQIAEISLPLEVLKARRNQRFLIDGILNNPWLWGASIYLISLLGLFWLRPLWLLKIYNFLKPIGFKIPLLGADISLGLLLFPKYHPRILDAWVTVHIKLVQEKFWTKDSVRARQVHIATPVILDGSTIAQLNGSFLRSKLDKRRSCLLIWGEGGIGKTSLAVEIAKWAMADNTAERLCKHQMLPVLIEAELDSEKGAGENILVSAIRGQLQDLTNQIDPIPEELLGRLLREQRILVIVDHFSEMSEATRKLIRPELPDFPVNALVITSRLDEKLGQVTKTTLKPLRIEGNRLSSFMEAYLTQRGKREQFSDVEFFDACSRLSTSVGARNITPLLATLYAEQLIGAKDRLEATQLPDNIPDIMLSYLNELNCNVTVDNLSDRMVHQDAKAIAWECLKQNYQPIAVSRDILIGILGGDDAEQRLKYLEERLRLIQNIDPAQNKIRFTLDPLAEYLAGLYLIDIYRDNEDSWREFLDRIETISGTKISIQGFLLAVWECCSIKGKDTQIPNFVIKELTNLVTLPKNIGNNYLL